MTLFQIRLRNSRLILEYFGFLKLQLKSSDRNLQQQTLVIFLGRDFISTLQPQLKLDWKQIKNSLSIKWEGFFYISVNNFSIEKGIITIIPSNDFAVKYYHGNSIEFMIFFHSFKIIIIVIKAILKLKKKLFRTQCKCYLLQL